MNSDKPRKKKRLQVASKILSFAMVTFVLAMTVIPLTNPSGVSASDNILDKPKINVGAGGPIIDIDPTPTPSVPILVDTEDEPQIDPGDVDLGDAVTQPTDDETEPTPQIDVPEGVDLLPEPPVIDLLDCVDTDGDGVTIKFPAGIGLLDGGQSVQLPAGISLNDVVVGYPPSRPFPSQPGAVIKISAGLNFLAEDGEVFVPDCD